jgi:hypothetical protein
MDAVCGQGGCTVSILHAAPLDEGAVGASGEPWNPRLDMT